MEKQGSVSTRQHLWDIYFEDRPRTGADNVRYKFPQLQGTLHLVALSLKDQ
jgi:hypothetical protein